MKIKVVIPTIRNADRVAKALKHDFIQIVEEHGAFEALIEGMSTLDYSHVLCLCDDFLPFNGWQKTIKKSTEQMMFDTSTEKFPQGFLKATSALKKPAPNGFISRKCISMPHVFSKELAKKIIERSKKISFRHSGLAAGQTMRRIMRYLGYRELYVYNKRLFKEI